MKPDNRLKINAGESKRMFIENRIREKMNLSTRTDLNKAKREKDKDNKIIWNQVFPKRVKIFNFARAKK